MNILRAELEEILEMQKAGAGFHYIQKAQQLQHSAQRSRQWYNLLKTPIWRWQTTLSETRYVLDELTEMGISQP